MQVLKSLQHSKAVEECQTKHFIQDTECDHLYGNLEPTSIQHLQQFCFVCCIKSGVFIEG